MTKPIPGSPLRLFRAALTALLLMAVPGHAQRADTNEDKTPPSFGTAGGPPNFVPPPPPSFSPPPAPTTVPPPANRASAPASRATPPASPTEADLLQGTSALVDDDDPEMQQVVGMIRIPEMGTNEVIEMLENFTGKPVLRQQTLPSVKITFFSQGALTRGEAIRVIESLLALNGIAVTNMGEKFLKAVPSAVINTQVARVWEGTTLNAIPSQTIYEKVFELDFLTTAEAVQLLQPLMSQGAPMAFEKSNLILITDALINLQRIERLLPVLDKPAALKTEMLFFDLQNIQAEEVVQRIQSLVQGPLKKQLENNTTVEGDERTNQLIIFTHPTNAPLIRNLIERLDVDVAPTTATKVFSIRYADATELVNIIEQIVTGQREVRQDTAGGDAAAAAAAARQRAAAARQNNQTVAAARAEATNLQFSDFLTIVPDERANTIVANGTHNDLKYLEQLINEIDTLLAQVRIEVVITDVSLTDSDRRGIDSFGFSYKGTGFDVDLDDPASEWTASPGDFYGVSSGFSWGPDEAFGLDLVLNTAASNSNIKVLSAPTIVTTHNKEATVSVGEERPVITSITSSDTTGGVVDRSQVQYRDIKLELKVTPLIGSDGIVQMEIEQTVQGRGEDVTVNGNSQPVINSRSATSYVSVRDRGMIALGGLQRLSTNISKGRMAILGKIPVIGDLFTSNDTEVTRTELLIFIRPTIVRTAEAADLDANQLIDVLEDSSDIRDYLEQGTFRPREEETDDPQRDVPRRNKP